MQAELPPGAIVGFDLVGQEDPGKTLLEYPTLHVALPDTLAMLPGAHTLGAVAPTAHADPGGHASHRPCAGSP